MDSAIAVRADLARDNDIDRLVDETRAAFGPIDVLVNNAAVTVPGRPPSKDAPAPTPAVAPVASARVTTTRPGSFLDFPLKGYRLHYQVGLFASYRLMQLVLPDMLELGRGAIVNISSLAAFIPGEGPYERAGGPTGFAYGGNKAAMHHLTEAVAFEMAQRNIAVNALLPSEPVLTPGNLVADVGETDWASADDFAEATLRVALADPAVMTGQILWSEDVLHPELGTRGWLRAALTRLNLTSPGHGGFGGGRPSCSACSGVRSLMWTSWSPSGRLGLPTSAHGPCGINF